MKYYFVEISTMMDGGPNPIAIWEKDTYTEAEIAYHQKLAYVMSGQDVESCLCMIIDGNGKTYMQEKWTRG